MLIIVMILMVISTIVVASSRRDILSLFLMSLMGSFVIMFSGAIIYIAKVGGYSKLQRTFLFLIPEFQTWLQYRPIPLGRLGYLVAIGRSLFPYFLLLISFEYSMVGWVRRHYKTLRIWAVLPPFLFLLYYYPPIFKLVVDKRFWIIILMRKIGLWWTGLYICLALSLLIIEYIGINIPFYKKRFRFIVLSLFSVTVLYGMYAIQDPGQIYNMHISEYIRIGSLSYIKVSLNNYGWIAVGLCTVFFVVLGTSSLIHHTQIDYKEDQEDIMIQRKFNASSLGTTVFIHSIKNHLLSSRVLHKRLEQEFNKPEPSTKDLQEQVEKLKVINEGMIARMDDLYKTVKSNALILKPYPLKDIIRIAISRFKQKYPNQEICVDIENIDEVLLADVTHLSEAIYNLLTNAYESTIVVDQAESIVEILIYEARLYTVIEIKDNGVGISNTKSTKIFEPFFTTKNTNSNWGMGLYYVRKIVKGHIGKLKIESVKNQGTSFFIMLPKFEQKNRGEKVEKDKDYDC